MMRNPNFSPDIRVSDQRNPEFRKQLDFLMRYVRAADIYNEKYGDDEDWPEHQDRAYNALYPPEPWYPPKKGFELAPDIGRFRDHTFDELLMRNLRGKKGN
jgi:hypothetical protein